MNTKKLILVIAVISALVAVSCSTDSGEGDVYESGVDMTKIRRETPKDVEAIDLTKIRRNTPKEDEQGE